jgi:hypothetical protein
MADEMADETADETADKLASTDCAVTHWHWQRGTKARLHDKITSSIFRTFPPPRCGASDFAKLQPSPCRATADKSSDEMADKTADRLADKSDFAMLRI